MCKYFFLLQTIAILFQDTIILNNIFTVFYFLLIL